MPRTQTVTQLVARVRELADIESMDATDGFIDDAEIIKKVDSAYTELYDMLVNKGIGQFESVQVINGTGAQSYALNSDFYAALHVSRKVSTNIYTPMAEIDINRIDNYSREAGTPLAFRIVGNNIEFYPPADSTETIELRYAPTATVLTSGAQTVDGVNGWEEFIVIESAIKCLIKEESDTEPLERRRADIVSRINREAENRTVGPRHVVDVKQRRVFDPADFWPRRGF